MSYKSQQMQPSLQTGLAYVQKWDIWYNGLVWQAVYDVITSFSTLELTVQNIPGGAISSTSTRIPIDRFVENVEILYDLVSILPEFQNTLFKEDIQKLQEEVARKRKTQLRGAHETFQHILKILNVGGHIRYKPPRDSPEEDQER